MATQAELLKREQDRANGVTPKKKPAPKPTTSGSTRGKAKDSLMDELGIKRMRINQTTDSNN